MKGLAHQDQCIASVKRSLQLARIAAGNQTMVPSFVRFDQKMPASRVMTLRVFQPGWMKEQCGRFAFRFLRSNSLDIGSVQNEAKMRQSMRVAWNRQPFLVFGDRDPALRDAQGMYDVTEEITSMQARAHVRFQQDENKSRGGEPMNTARSLPILDEAADCFIGKIVPRGPLADR